MDNATKDRQRRPGDWREFWPAELINPITLMSDPYETRTIRALNRLDEQPQVHDWLKQAQGDHGDLQARAVAAICGFYVSRGSGPVYLRGAVAPSVPRFNPGWWRRVQAKHGYGAWWFDIVFELSTQRFRNLTGPGSTQRALHRDARAGKLVPQAFFFALSPDPGSAIAAVCSKEGDQIAIAAVRVSDDQDPRTIHPAVRGLFDGTVALLAG